MMTQYLSSLLALLLLGVTLRPSEALSCMPGDIGCAQCQASCDAIPLPALPECCEAYSACCPTYSKACGRCEANAVLDPHFPEYCCASFTDCCHMVPGLNFVAGTTVKQGSKLPAEQALDKGAKANPGDLRSTQARSESVLEPQTEPEPAASTATVLDELPTTHIQQEGTTLPEHPSTSPTTTIDGQSGVTDQSLLTDQERDNDLQETTAVAEETTTPAATGSVRGRGRTRASPSAPAPTTAALDSTSSRNRQATTTVRRTRPTFTDRKIMQAGSEQRRGRVTSRGRVIL